MRREQQRLLERRWRELPARARTPTQMAGVAGVACGATHGVMERCNIACTSCYLTGIANRTRPLPFDQVRAQLDELRAHLGHGGKAQITSGEVTMLPLEDLGRIVSYADRIGLDPMVMTNGIRFLEEPLYLERLVADHGLRKFSFHVDVTQRGRSEHRPGARERDLHPVRDRLASEIRRVRRTTGARVHAAHTVTVTSENLRDVEDVVEWALDHADAVRMLSFLPAASVGRTEDRLPQDVSLEAVWERVCAPFGRTLDPEALQFGHPECNITVPVLVVSGGGWRDVVELTASEADRRFVGEAIRLLAPRVNFNRSAFHVALASIVAGAPRPRFLLRSLAYVARRLWSSRGVWGRALGALARLRRVRLNALMLVVHRFMSPAELATPIGQERLSACVFKLPVDGRMVSMCEMNATGLRIALNTKQLRNKKAGHSAA